MKIRRDDRGATAVEYGLYVALVAGAILGGVVFLTGALGLVFSSVAADPMIVGGTSTVAATPSTPAPSTPAPSTPAPSTPAPSTPAPSTPAPSTPAPSTPAPSTPAATAPGKARALAASSPAKGKVTVSWDAPTDDGGSAVLGYDVEIDDITGGSTCAATFSASATQKVLSNTTSFTSVPGTKYCLRVRVINAKGTSDWAQTGPVSVIAVTKPGVPGSVDATSPSGGTLTVTWTAPGDDGGTDITGYDVEIDDRTGSSTCASSFSDSDATNVTSTSATFTGLDGYAYCVRVRAANAEGDSSWTQAGVFAMTASAPGTPRKLAKDGASSSSMSLKWDAPTSTGGADVSDYVVEYRKQGSDAWLVFADGVSKSTKATVTKLAKETTYEFRVAAVNSAGQGGYSSTATYKTEKD